jgi:hypothetical protein
VKLRREEEKGGGEGGGGRKEEEDFDSAGHRTPVFVPVQILFPHV